MWWGVWDGEADGDGVGCITGTVGLEESGLGMPQLGVWGHPWECGMGQGQS